MQLILNGTILAKPFLIPVNFCGNTLDMIPLATHPTAFHHLVSIVCRTAIAVYLDRDYFGNVRRSSLFQYWKRVKLFLLKTLYQMFAHFHLMENTQGWIQRICNVCYISYGKQSTIKMKGTKVQTLGGRAVAGAWPVAWAIMAMGAIINTHAHR